MDKYKQLFRDTRYEQYYKKMLKLLLYYIDNFEKKLAKIDELCDEIKDKYIKELQKNIPIEMKNSIIEYLGSVSEMSELIDGIIDENDTIINKFEKGSLVFDWFIKDLDADFKKFNINEEFVESKKYTLQEAMIKILKENSKQMKVQRLVDELNSRELYKKKDLSEIQYAQIYARAKRDNLFILKDGIITLKNEE